MRLDDKLTRAYFNEATVEVAATPTTLFTASNKSIKVFDLKNTSSEPEVINTLSEVKNIDIKYTPNEAYVLIAGGNDCVWHDVSNFVIKENGDHLTNDDSTLSEMKQLWKSSSKITQAIFTHGGQRACVGDLAANMVIVDISNPKDDSTFGKVVERIKVNGEITGLSYNYSVDLLAVTVADGGLSIYSLSSDIPEKKATVGNILVDKRIALTHEMGLVDDDSDLSDDFSDEEDSMVTETTSGIGGKSQRNKKERLLKFAAAKTVWTPVGDMLAVPNKNFKIDFYNMVNWASPVFSLSAGPMHHKNSISALAFSPNGKFLASTDLDRMLLIWDISNKKIVGRSYIPIIGVDITWPDDTSIIIGSDKDNILMIDKDTFNSLLAQRLIPESNQNNAKENERENQRPTAPAAPAAPTAPAHEDSDDMGDDVMESNDEEDEEDMNLDQPNSQDLDGFVIDDEENNHYNYAADENTRRRNHDGMSESTELTDANKRARRENSGENHMYRLNIKSGWGKTLTKPFSVGSTPFEGSDRRYLTITPVGAVYTVKTQQTFKITVLFFDEENHRKYFFDDLVGYDICSINDQGSVFATSGFRKNKGFTARVEYKDHSDGRNVETKWIREINLRPYEFITSLSVYGNFVFVCTNKGFVRKFNLYGRLLNITMMDCVVGIMNNNNYVFTIIKRSIESGYLFNIQNIDGDYIQQEVGIPLITENDLNDNTSEIPIKSMFFSDEGEPCIVRNDNLLLVLTKWRDQTSKPIWKPLLDIQEGVSRAGRGRELKAWPLGLFGDSFAFVPFRGSKNYPIFPLLTPMNVDIRIPINYEDPSTKEKDRIPEEDAELFGDDMDSNANNIDGDVNNPEVEKAENPEEKFLRTLVLAEMLNDAISNNDIDGNSDTIERLQLLSLEYDKTLLIQIDDACSSGDSDDAFELCKMIRDFRALNAAQKLAEVKGLAGLARRIRDLREARIAEEEENIEEDY